MTGVHADRAIELADIAQRVQAPRQKSPLGLVCGSRQIGKTELLLQASLDRRRRPTCRINLELAYEPEEVLQRLVTGLRPVEFRSYAKVLQAIPSVQPTMTFGDVTMSGDATMRNIVDGQSQRASNTRRLTPPFVEDLRRAQTRRPLLLFDHFDRCPSAAVRAWLQEDLLRDLAGNADVLVLVAAEFPPWGSRSKTGWIDGIDPFILHLQPLNVDDVVQWMADLSIAPDRVLADFLVRTRKGVPGPIADDLVLYLAAGGTGRA